jgi:hypothetical protein
MLSHRPGAGQPATEAEKTLDRLLLLRQPHWAHWPAGTPDDSCLASPPREAVAGPPGPLRWRPDARQPPPLPTLDDYEPRHLWHHQPATTRQLRYLARLGLGVTRPLTRGEAAYLLDQAADTTRAFEQPATRRQRELLGKLGQARLPDGMSRGLAEVAIQVRLRARGRRRKGRRRRR